MVYLGSYVGMPHHVSLLTVLRKDAAGLMISIEAMLDFESAKARAINLSRYIESEFVVFDQHEQVAASCRGTYRPPPQEKPGQAASDFMKGFALSAAIP
jgi:hypothetical protein